MIKRLSILILLLALSPASAQVQEPMHIMVLVDVTHTPGAELRDAARLNAVQEWLRLLPTGRTTVAVYQYDQAQRVVAPFTPLASGQQLQELIEKTKAITITAEDPDLKGALSLALAELSKTAAAEQGKGVVVLLTEGRIGTGDGTDNVALNVQTLTDLRSGLLPRFAQKGIRIFTLAFTDDANSLLLREISRETKGSFHLGFQQQALQNLYMGIFNQVLRPPAPRPRTRIVELEAGAAQALFILERESVKDDMTVRAPEGGDSYSSLTPDEQENAKWQISPETLLLCLAQPQAGLWTITNTLSPADKVSLLPDPKLIIDVPNASIGENEPLMVNAWLTSNGKRIASTVFLDSLQWEARLFNSPDDEGQLLGSLSGGDGASGSESEEVLTGSFSGDFGEGSRRLQVTARSDIFQVQAETQILLAAGRLHANLEREEGAPGELLPLRVLCEPPGGESIKLTVKAIIIDPDGDASTVTIEDFAPNQYSEALTGFDKVGHYVITVVAQGVAKNGELYVDSSSPFHYQVREPEAVPNVDDGQSGKLDSQAEDSAATDDQPPAASGWMDILIVLQGLIVVATGVFLLMLWHLGRQQSGAQDAKPSKKQARKTRRKKQQRAFAPQKTVGSGKSKKSSGDSDGDQDAKNARKAEAIKKGKTIDDGLTAEIAKLEADWGLIDEDSRIEDLPDFDEGVAMDDDEPATLIMDAAPSEDAKDDNEVVGLSAAEQDLESELEDIMSGKSGSSDEAADDED